MREGRPQSGAALPVSVLPHQDALPIGHCLERLFAADPAMAFDVFVLANGCTDRTEAIVADYAARRPAVHLVSIGLGDKCNAWNVFVHETVAAAAPAREVYFFMDGDARAASGSFSAMLRALREQPRAQAASAAPGGWSNRRPDAHEIARAHRLVAYHHGLRGAFD